MNKAFKILWNDARRSYIVSDETTRSHGKPAKAMVVAVAVALAGFPGSLLLLKWISHKALIKL